MILSEHRIPLKFKEKLCKTAIRPAVLNGIGCWVVKKQYVNQMHVVEMVMLTWIHGNTRKYRIWNDEIPLKIGDPH